MKMKTVLAIVLATTMVVLASKLSWEDQVKKECPVLCSCDIRRRHEVDITCRDLLYVPSGLPAETTRLDLSHNHLQHITRDTFRFRHTNKSRVRVLDMRYSSIETIDVDAFENTLENSIRHVYLSHNNLTDTKTLVEVFKRFQVLIYFDLTHNAGINCVEVRKKLGMKVKSIGCDDHVGHTSTTTESPLSSTPTAPSIPTPGQVSLIVKYSDQISTPSPISSPNTTPSIAPLADNKATEPTSMDDSDSSASLNFNTGFVIVISFAFCVVVICILVYFIMTNGETNPFRRRYKTCDFQEHDQ